METTSEEIKQKLKEYSELKHNWDGYDGVPVGKDVLNSAHQLFEIIEKSGVPLPSPMVGGDNEIGFYWYYNDYYIEISIRKNVNYSFIIVLNKNYYGDDNISTSVLHNSIIDVLTNKNHIRLN